MIFDIINCNKNVIELVAGIYMIACACRWLAFKTVDSNGVGSWWRDIDSCRANFVCFSIVYNISCMQIAIWTFFQQLKMVIRRGIGNWKSRFFSIMSMLRMPNRASEHSVIIEVHFFQLNSPIKLFILVARLLHSTGSLIAWIFQFISD